MMDVLEIPHTGEMLNIGDVPGDQVVEADDVVALRQKAVTEMRAQEACSASDHGQGPQTLVRQGVWHRNSFVLRTRERPTRVWFCPEWHVELPA